MYYYDDYDGWVPIFVSRFGQRDDHSHADFLDSNVPLWRDIFDGQIEQQQKTFLQVVSDESCMDLANADTLGILDTKAEQCKARELFKYSTFLEACNVSMQQMLIFINHPDIGGVFKSESSSGYAVALEVIEEKIEDGAQRELARQRLEKGLFAHYLVAIRVRAVGLLSATGQ